MTHNPPLNFKLTHFLLSAKGSIESLNSETFECVSENFSKSSYHSWEHKSAFIQILHQYSVPLKISSLNFFSSNIIYFGQRSQLKCKNLRFLSTRVKIRQISHVNFEITTQFFFKFYIVHSSLSWHLTLRLILCSYIFLWSFINEGPSSTSMQTCSPKP